MALPDVLRADEVILAGGRYRLSSPIAVRDISPFPPKQVTGDFTKDDQQLRSVDVSNDWAGGGLLQKMDGDQGVDRWWDSTLETRYRKELRLPARAIQVLEANFPNDAGVFQNFRAIALADYIANSGFVSERLFVLYRGPDAYVPGAYKLRVGKWDGAYQRFTQSLPTASEPTNTLDTNVFTQADVGGHSYLLLGHSGGYAYYNPVYDPFATAPSYWRVHGAGSGYPGMTHGVNWDGRFWILHVGDHILKVTSDLDAWTVKASLPYRLGPLGDLVVGYNQNQEPTITAVCEGGVFQYDAVADEWLETNFTWPHFYKGGTATMPRQNKLHVGLNSMVFEWDGNQARSIGLDREYGMPVTRRGAITGLTDAFSYILATLDLRQGDPSTAPSLMAYDGVGWHTFWIAPQVTTTPNTIGCVHMTSIVEQTRLWFGYEDHMYYIPQEAGVFNPYQVLTTEYAAGGYLVRPWFIGSWPGDKLALSVEVDATCPTPNETVAIEYALNYDEADTAWRYLGQVNQTGTTTFVFEDGAGLIWRAIRWRYTLGRGAVLTNTPIIHSVVFTYKKVMPPLYAFTFQVDMTQDYDGLSPAAQYQRLVQTVASGPLVRLQLRTNELEIVNAPVDITAFSATVGAGTDGRSAAQLACTTV